MDYLAKDASGGRKDQFWVQFSVRSLLWLFVVISLLIGGVQFAWPRRTVSKTVFAKHVYVEDIKPHIESIVKGDSSIKGLRIDPRFNSLTVIAQARNIEAATRHIELLIAEPHLMHAASSLDMTIHEVRELLAESSEPTGKILD